MYKHIFFYKLPLCSHIFIICAVLCDLILIYPHYVISVCLLYVHVFSNILMNGVTCLHLMQKSNYQANTVLLHLLGEKIPTNNWRIMKTVYFIALFKEAICNGITCSIILKKSYWHSGNREGGVYCQKRFLSWWRLSITQQNVCFAGEMSETIDCWDTFNY